MSDFIASHIDRHVLVEETASKICTLCQDDLVKSEDVDFAGEKESSDQTDDNENLTVVHVLPCDHLFHASYIERWLGSTAERRNRCPSCRADLCRLNCLSPEQIAAEADPNDPHLNLVVLADLYRQNDIFGYVYIELVTGRRVRNRLIESDNAESWDAWQLRGLLRSMERQFDRMVAARSETPSRDPSPEPAPSTPSISSSGSTVRNSLSPLSDGIDEWGEDDDQAPFRGNSERARALRAQGYYTRLLPRGFELPRGPNDDDYNILEDEELMSLTAERQPARALSVGTPPDPASRLHQQEQLFEDMNMIRETLGTEPSQEPVENNVAVPQEVVSEMVNAATEEESVDEKSDEVMKDQEGDSEDNLIKDQLPKKRPRTTTMLLRKPTPSSRPRRTLSLTSGWLGDGPQHAGSRSRLQLKNTSLLLHAALFGPSRVPFRQLGQPVDNVEGIVFSRLVVGAGRHLLSRIK
jgi:hypothetical protein